MAFEALTGGLPFGGGTLVEIAHRRTEQDPPRASDRSPEVPPAVDDVLLRGLAREPGERWGTATAFVDGLEQRLRRAGPASARAALPAQPVQAPAPAPAAQVTWSRQPRRRSRTAPILLGLAAIAVGLIVGLTVLNGNGGSGGGTDRSPERPRSAQRDEQRQQERPQTTTTAPAPAEPQQSGASPAQLNDQGFALMNSGDYDRAIPVLERAVAAFPEGQHGHHARVRALQPRPLAAPGRAPRRGDSHT